MKCCDHLATRVDAINCLRPRKMYYANNIIRQLGLAGGANWLSNRPRHVGVEPRSEWM